MIFHPTELDGAYVIAIERLHDERGFFARSFCMHEFEDHGLNSTMAQCNISYNRRRGTLRGMHFQVSPHEEAKLVRCTRGAIYDVIVDLRPDSPTFMRHTGVHLTPEEHTMLYVPEGFAHGFLTLADDTEVFYQMSQFYVPGAAAGFRWDDPAFAIDWPEFVHVISARDATYPDFARVISGGNGQSALPETERRTEVPPLVSR